MIIDHILDEHCPQDLVAGVHNFCYHNNQCQALETKIKALHKKSYWHLEQSVNALSDLENANILGRLIAHVEEFEGDTKAYASFFKAVSPFKGQVTYSGSNTQIDPSMTNHLAFGLPASAVTVCNNDRHIKPITNTFKAIHKDDRSGLTKTAPFHANTRCKFIKQCHKGRLFGHICRDCPNHRPAHTTHAIHK